MIGMNRAKTETPEEVLASDGLDRGQRQVLDPAKGLAIVS
jgi:hypothetical protein